MKNQTIEESDKIIIEMNRKIDRLREVYKTKVPRWIARAWIDVEKSQNRARAFIAKAEGRT